LIDLSETNVELARRAIEAYNARDLDALIALYDPQLELHSTFAAVGGAVYHGHQGLRKYFRDLEDAWEGEIQIEPEAFFDFGEQTLVFNTLRARGRQSGAEVEMPVALVARWRDNLIVYFKGYARREDALRELGVSEGALEPITP
jgi:ketosteroid isomerase-like protein